MRATRSAISVWVNAAVGLVGGALVDADARYNVAKFVVVTVNVRATFSTVRVAVDVRSQTRSRAHAVVTDKSVTMRRVRALVTNAVEFLLPEWANVGTNVRGRVASMAIGAMVLCHAFHACQTLVFRQF